MRYRFPKACCCCGTIVGSLKRVCPSCKVPAIWRPLTEQEIAERNARNAKHDALIKELLADSPRETCVRDPAIEAALKKVTF